MVIQLDLKPLNRRTALPMSASESEIDRAWTAFYVEYGNAMVAWQIVERELATLFSLLTKIAPDMAIRIFYAPRSFNGRIDIFKSALVTCKVSEDIKSFTRKLLAKAKSYSDCRNAFAHDQPLLHQFGTPAEFAILLVDGKGQFQSDVEKKRYIDLAITVPEIAEIAINFRHLGKLIEDFWSQLTIRNTSLDRLRERLAALPNLPPSKDRSQPTRTAPAPA
jgi:hypothetical protein